MMWLWLLVVAGKTSTTELICKIFEDNGYKVGCNREGSNLTEGVTTMILNACSLNGECKKDILIIESDERYLRHTLKHFRPKYLVVLNLYRDQLGRNGHPELIYDIIKEAIADDIHLVLNADDPLVASYGFNRDNVTYFGMSKNDFSTDEFVGAANDGAFCPVCKEPMEYDFYHYNHIGSYKCKACGYKRMTPQHAVTNLDLANKQLTINNKHKITMDLSSVFTAYNLLAAFAVAKLVGVKEEKIIEPLNEYVLQNGRVQKYDINGKPCTILMAKHENTVSYNQNLLHIVREKIPSTVVLILDDVSRRYFTVETAWLWDIDFELLKSDSVKKIIIGGRYVHDYTTRIEFAGVDMKKVVGFEDLDDMMKEVKEKPKGDIIYLVTCFLDKTKFIARIKD